MNYTGERIKWANEKDDEEEEDDDDDDDDDKKDGDSKDDGDLKTTVPSKVLQVDSQPPQHKPNAPLLLTRREIRRSCR